MNGKELVRYLSGQLMGIQAGERLPSIREFAASARMSMGAISQALNSLEEAGAIKIEKRGHLGSFIGERSIGKLWTLTEQGPLVIAFTLPMHLRFEGLATGIKRSLSQAGIPAYFIFIRGSRMRLEAVRHNRCHAAVMSGLAAEKLATKREEIGLRLPPGSWISNYSIFYRPPGDEAGRPLRVATDQDSFDHQFLTELEFAGQKVELKHYSYIQFPRLLRNGEIDAVIWTEGQKEAYLSPGVLFRPLSSQVQETVGEKSVSATFVIRKRQNSVRALFAAALDPNDIMNVQSRVVAGEMIPEY